MLTNKLTGAGASNPPIALVGSKVQAIAGGTSNVNVSLTDLTGGLASAPSANDMVIVFFSTGSASNMALSVSGYTEITKQYYRQSVAVNLLVAYKFMGSTPDTTLTLVGGTKNFSDSGAVVVFVWRNVNTTNPFAATFTAHTLNGGYPNPPNITFSETGVLVMAGGASGHYATGVPYFSSSDLSGFQYVFRNGAAESNYTTAGAGYKFNATGSYDPSQFGGATSLSSSIYARAAVTLALRKA